MRYVDTSVLLAYLMPESGSQAAEVFMMSAGEPLAVSSWTEVELLSALGVKLRSRQLTEGAARAVLDAYSRLVSPQLRHLAVDDADPRQTLMLLDGWRTALRAGDALHLAIAQANGATLYTLDRALAAAGSALGVPVVLVA